MPHWLAYMVCVLFGGVVNLAYGMVFGPAFARRDPLVKMMGTLGLALVLLGLMAWRAPIGGAFARFLPLPSSPHHYTIWGTSVSLTQIIAIGLAFAITAGSQRLSAGDEARHRDAGAGQRPRDRPPRSASRCGGSRPRPGSGRDRLRMAGLLLPDLLTSLDYSALTFLVISSLAAALIGRLRSLWMTLFGGLAVGVSSAVRPVPRGLRRSPRVRSYRAAAPFVLAIIALLYLSRRRVVTISRTAH